MDKTNLLYIQQEISLYLIQKELYALLAFFQTSNFQMIDWKTAKLKINYPLFCFLDISPLIQASLEWLLAWSQVFKPLRVIEYHSTEEILLIPLQ